MENQQTDDLAKDELSVIAVGDISLSGIYRQKRYQSRKPWENIPLRGKAELCIANFESPITDANRFSQLKFGLRANTNAKNILRDSDFDILNLANNHAMDFGPQGLLDTIQALSDLGIAHVGAGENLEQAQKRLDVLRNKKRVGILSFCDVIQISPLYAEQAGAGVAPLNQESTNLVSKSAEENDWTIVCLHWGSELNCLPSPEQRKNAEKLVDAGADAIVGHHPHVLQPVEVFGNVPVWYSLGNFTFSDEFWNGVNERGEPFVAEHRLHPLARKTGVAEMILSKNAAPQLRLRHAEILNDGRVVLVSEGEQSNQWDDFCARLRQVGYEDAWLREQSESLERLKFQSASSSLIRKLRLKAYQFGLLK